MSKIYLTETMLVRPNSALLESTGRKGYIVEKREPGQPLKVKIPATIMDEINENQRNYSTKVMQIVIERSKPAFESKELLSTVNEHPESPYVTPGEASHIVTGAWIEGKTMWNEWTIMGTANGKNLEALVESGAAFGVSIRGLGSVDSMGNILEDYEYLGTDCVGQPSARIRPRAEVIENAGTRPSDESVKDRAMTIKDKDLKAYVTEQVVLLKNDPDQISAFRRAASVEDVISECKAAPKEVAEVYQLWEDAKKEVFEKKDTAKTYSAEQVAELVRKATEIQTTFRQVMKDSSAENAKVQARLEATSKVAIALKAKLEEARKDRGLAVENAAKTRVRLNRAMTLLAKARANYESAVDIAAVDRVRYSVAVQEAAKALVSRNAIKESYQYLISLTGKAIKEGKLVVGDILSKEVIGESFTGKKGKDGTKIVAVITEHKVPGAIKEDGEKPNMFTEENAGIRNKEHAIPGFI